MGLSLSAKRVSALLAVMRELSNPRAPIVMRQSISRHLIDLFEADYLASYEWNAERGRFEAGIQMNMDPSNLARYEAYYQFHDPITFKLQARRRATAVVEIMPQAALGRTEFFNDFLSRDGLYWGMNVYAFDGARNVGDLRVWRSRNRQNFSRDDLILLDEVGRAFGTALVAAREIATPALKPTVETIAARFGLTHREGEVAALISQGCADPDVAKRLGIGHATVRTHLGRIFGKVGVTSRAALVVRILQEERNQI